MECLFLLNVQPSMSLMASNIIRHYLSLHCARITGECPGRVSASGKISVAPHFPSSGFQTVAHQDYFRKEKLAIASGKASSEKVYSRNGYSKMTAMCDVAIWQDISFEGIC